VVAKTTIGLHIMFGDGMVRSLNEKRRESCLKM